MVNFVSAVAYHFCLAVPAAFAQPGDHLLADLCMLSSFAFVFVAIHAFESIEEWNAEWIEGHILDLSIQE